MLTKFNFVFFGKTSFGNLHLPKLHLEKIHSAKLHTAKVHLAWFGCANTFTGFARFSNGYTDKHQNKPENFDQTFYSFGRPNLAKLHLVKLHLAWIGCANPFTGFVRFSTGYANGYRLYWERESVTVTEWHFDIII